MTYAQTRLMEYFLSRRLIQYNSTWKTKYLNFVEDDKKLNKEVHHRMFEKKIFVL